MVSKKFIDNLNEKILELFHNKKGQYPVLYSEKMFSNTAKILFIWLNPAGKDGGYVIVDYKIDELNPKEEKFWNNSKEYIYEWPLLESENREKNIELIKTVHKDALLWNSKLKSSSPYDYYKEFYKLFSWDSDTPSYLSKDQWNVIDLFLSRWTNQKEIEKSIRKNDSFFSDQYEQFMLILEELDPDFIIVCSAYAREYLLKKWDIHFENDFDQKNWHWNKQLPYKKLLSKSKIILFTWMLSWQRAIDIGTKKILKWNIDRILKKLP